MSQQTVDSEASTEKEDPILSKIYAQLNEEKLSGDFTSLQLNKFKPLDELTGEVVSAPNSDELISVLEENLGEVSNSLVSRYIVGLVGIQKGHLEKMVLLRTLLEDFRKAAKWTIVDHIADQILEHEPNNRIALRAKVESTERLKGKKELKPYLERLAAIDRKNPDIVKKYALSILEEDQDKALGFLKQAGETYARVKDYKNLEEVWNLVVNKGHEDLPFFERIERVLVGNREKTRVAAYFVTLLEPYRIEENWNAVITILKKILQYEPISTRARSELVRAYRHKYEGHSLLDDFLKMSELTNNKKQVGPCIASFERNIVFDKDNYVYHRTRGVGKITSIDNENVIIDFRDNPGQRMSIQMAITSLKPLGPDHIWVKLYENPDEIHTRFAEDLPAFFETLLSSFNYKMTLSEIKQEVCPRFITIEEWSKWWSRARTRLKKEPKFGFNPRKKDELHLRETPMTLSEELQLKFQSLTDWNKKLELALETLKDADTEGAAEICVQYYGEQENNKDTLKKIHSHMFLTAASNALGEDDVHHTVSEQEIMGIFRASPPEVLVQYCSETTPVDLKKEIINKIIKTRDDYPLVLKNIMFEFPIKVNKYVLTELNRLEQYDTLEEFLKITFTKFRDYPEIFLWSARSILTNQWDYDWIKYGREEVVLLIFRILKPLARIEKKGTRMKNNAVETLFGTTNITVDSAKVSPLAMILEDAVQSNIRRMAALFREVPYIPDAHKENFVDLIKEIRPDFKFESGLDDDGDETGEEVDSSVSAHGLIPEEGIILASPAGLEKRKAYYDNLVNVEMPANSNDIGEAQEKGDLRENAEYKAAMERQSQLQAEIKRIDAEIKSARMIRPEDVVTDVVCIGSKVACKSADGGEQTYTIFGPWEVDADNNIISYLSPLGKSLLGKKPGETAQFSDKKFEVQSIASAL